MIRESSQEFTSPIPPPPPPEHSSSLQNILDDYYEGSSYSSDEEYTRNSADLMLAEIDQISPSNESETDRVRMGTTEFPRHEPTESMRLQEDKPVRANEEKLVEILKSDSTENTMSNQNKSPLELCAENKKKLVNHCVSKRKDVPQDANPQPSVKPESDPVHQRDGAEKKKAFLRKGARKEPSAMHRFNEEKQRLAHRNVESKKDQESKQLAHLERMQEQQRENLQKRIERRQRAREEIHRKKKGCQIQVVDQDTMTEVKQSCNRKVTTGEGDIESESEYEDSDSLLESESSDEEESEGDEKSAKKEEVVVKRKRPNASRFTKKGNKNPKRSPLKPVNKIIIKSSKTAASKEFQTPEMEEQWQIIKSMRRRQETTLRAAEKEREEVKSWAASEREKLKKWKDTQRSLIQKEKQRAANSAMIAQRKQRKETLEEQAAEEARCSYRQMREEIEVLKEALHKSKIEADAIKSRHRLNEKRWKDSVTEREKKIEDLKDELGGIILKNQKLKHDKDELNKKLEKEVAEQKRLKKKNKEQKSALKKQKMKVQDELETEQDSTKGKRLSSALQIQEDKTLHHSHVPHICAREEESEEVRLPTKLLPNEQPGVLRKNIRELDKDVSKILASNNDLIEGPKENWLRCELSETKKCSDAYLTRGPQDIDTVTNVSTSLAFHTPMKGKPYNPTDYANEPRQHGNVTQNANSNVHASESSVTVNYPQNKMVSNNQRMITFQNGTTKESLPDGTMIVRFTNGDIKTAYANLGITVYYYAEAMTTHTTHKDGLEVFEFVSGQTERHYPDGSKVVNFPDGTSQNFSSTRDV